MTSDTIRPGLVSALLGTFARDVRDLVRNPLAFFGGLGGTLLTVVLLVISLVLAKDASADDDEDDELAIDFVPGALTKLGSPAKAKDIPEKVVRKGAEVPEETVQEAVTEEERIDPQDKPKDKKQEKPDLPKPVTKPTGKLPTSNPSPFKDPETDSKRTDPNAKDLPNLNDEGNDPFGDPNGWADMRKDGDPWATAVMAALQNVPAPSYGGQPVPGDFRFQITVCKDGRIKEIRPKGGNMAAEHQGRFKINLEAAKLPRPPPDVIKKMRSDCAKIGYTFRYNAARGVQ